MDRIDWPSVLVFSPLCSLCLCGESFPPVKEAGEPPIVDSPRQGFLVRHLHPHFSWGLPSATTRMREVPAMKTMLRSACCAGFFLVALFFLSRPVQSAPQARMKKSREFRFAYQATVTGLAKGQMARIWLPVPPSNEEQQVKIVEQRLP